MDNADSHILSGIVSGDKRAFTLLFDRYYEKLCNYVASILFDHDTAEDLIQDLFATIWVNRKQLSIKTSFRSYLFRSAYYSSLDYLKHLKVKNQFVTITKDQLEFSYEDSLIVTEMHDRMEKSIEQLPEQCRHIFKLSRFENLKYKEIADKLKISENTVDTQIRRALRKLKDEMKDYLVTILIVLKFFF